MSSTPECSALMSATGATVNLNWPRQQRPLVVVVGWLGAQPRHLEKYAQIWKDARFDVVSVIPTAADCFIPFKRQTKARDFLSLLELILSGRSRQEQESGVTTGQSELFFHVFSNNGGLFVSTCMNLIENARKSPTRGPKWPTIMKETRFQGMILDSCPSALEFREAMNAFTTGVTHNFVFRVLFSALLWCMLGVSLVLSVLSHPLDPGQWRSLFDRMDYWKNLAKFPGPVSLVYTPQDAIIRAKSIEDFAQLLREQKKSSSLTPTVTRSVQLHSIENSRHVGLLHTHKQEYLAIVRNFERQTASSSSASASASEPFVADEDRN